MKSFTYNDTFNVSMEITSGDFGIDDYCMRVTITITHWFYENKLYEIEGIMSSLADLIYQPNRKYALLLSSSKDTSNISVDFVYGGDICSAYSCDETGFSNLILDEDGTLSFRADFSDEEIVVSFKVEDVEVTEFSKPSK